ncbi:DL-endopeptidase inhibitor IseA family protein [Brevibacillus choshinensis]|uniref:Uncharacterized protein n=1 Tax=Brevibacillus choshinensis TaxID=54911 RepID=A0ABX7FJM1_BRECH|nr:DL-endopeptidase inhibitor IseA family protein [Brevibacillus choshinensis]QRG66281.1 hypothetical protein JNE38_22455 [Brevibacillus choshinensis]
MRNVVIKTALLASTIFALTPLTSFAASLPTVQTTQVSTAKTATPVPQMDEKQIVNLVTQAKNLFWQVQTAKTDKKAFEFKEIPYVYLNDTFSTKEKIVSAFEQVYTKEASNFYFDQAGFELYQDKVTVVDGDFGSLLEWDKATAVLSSERPSAKTYQLSVPLGDTGESEEVFVTVKLIPDLGWRIINSPNEIR